MNRLRKYIKQRESIEFELYVNIKGSLGYSLCYDFLSDPSSYEHFGNKYRELMKITKSEIISFARRFYKKNYVTFYYYPEKKLDAN